jgi:hypothetical protein
MRSVYKMWLKRVKGNIKKRLEKLAEENRKLYGGKKLDCCSINRTQAIKNKKIG